MEIKKDVRELSAREQSQVNGGESRLIPVLPVEPVWPGPWTPIGPLIPGFLEP